MPRNNEYVIKAPSSIRCHSNNRHQTNMVQAGADAHTALVLTVRA